MATAKAKTYGIVFEGVSPILMHHDNIDWADEMEAWKAIAKKNKEEGKAGDDRSPAWRWLGHATHDGEHLALPADWVMACLMGGGAMVSAGKGNASFKSAAMSGLILMEPYAPLLVSGALVPMAPLFALKDEPDFRKHEAVVSGIGGLSLFKKRARVGLTKHVRVRLRIDPPWTCEFRVAVSNPKITRDVLADIVGAAGNFKGIGDWRPGGKTPGGFGIFSGSVSEL